MSRAPASPWRLAVRHFAWAVPLGPASVVVHELGHLLTGRAFGYPTRLHAGSASGGPSLETSEPLIAGMAAASGPLASIVLTVVAALLIARRGPHPALVAIALFDSLRMLLTILGLGGRALIVWQGAEVGPLNSDDYDVVRAFGMPAVPIMVALNLGLIAIWTWTIRRIPASRALNLAALATGSALGLVLWFNLAGPALLD